jgi:DNA-directed RNA polymerase subunit alpha
LGSYHVSAPRRQWDAINRAADWRLEPSGRKLMSRTRIPISQYEEQARLTQERLELPTAEIGLSVRTTNCLEEKGIFTVRDLLNSKPEDLLSIANFGEKTLEEVYQALEKFGFYRPARKPSDPKLPR